MDETTERTKGKDAPVKKRIRATCEVCEGAIFAVYLNPDTLEYEVECVANGHIYYVI